MADARLRYDEQARWDGFERRSREWRAITQHRAFLAAMQAAVVEYHGPERDEVIAHLDFAERRLDETDPVKHPALVLPGVPEPKSDDLKPFLVGWSPHGP